MADKAKHSPATELCPVCRDTGALAQFVRVEASVYWRCSRCEATILDPAQRPGHEAEYAQYLHHENAVDDPGYRAFLSKLADPLLEQLAPRSAGLDYGCGPGPALARMLEEAGHSVSLYDPFFAPDPGVLERRYDFVTCTETAEHFHDPAAEFDTMAGLIRPGGWLAIMTCFQTDDALFSGWHYRKDPTHVVFYREETMHCLAAQRGMDCTIARKDIALMRKPG